MYKYGILIDADMIRNTFETNTGEALSLVNPNAVIWILATSIIPAILLLLTDITYFPLKKELKERGKAVIISIIVLFCFIGISYKHYMSFGRNNRHLRKAMNTVNYTYSTFRYFQKKALTNRAFLKLDENAELTAIEDPYPTVLVIIVGETARSKNFSLDGYKRKTNPSLEKQDILYFHDVHACGTSTAISVPCMFSHMDRDNFNVNDAKYTENLLDILKTGGYDILWLENDGGCKGVCDRVNTIDMVATKHPKHCYGSYCHDEVLLEPFEEALKNIKGNTVIVLHTMGSHGPTYYNRYPENFKVFSPTCDTANIQKCTKEEIINTYDNTIVYTDFIISSIIDIMKKFSDIESGMIYVSDHGESLGENNIYLHGFPYKIAPAEQREVPMVIWMSENMKKYDYIDYQCMKSQGQINTYEHDHLFHSILALMEVKTKMYDSKYDMFKPCRLRPLPF